MYTVISYHILIGSFSFFSLFFFHTPALHCFMHSSPSSIVTHPFNRNLTSHTITSNQLPITRTFCRCLKSHTLFQSHTPTFNSKFHITLFTLFVSITLFVFTLITLHHSLITIFVSTHSEPQIVISPVAGRDLHMGEPDPRVREGRVGEGRVGVK